MPSVLNAVVVFFVGATVGLAGIFGPLLIGLLNDNKKWVKIGAVMVGVGCLILLIGDVINIT